MAELEYYLKKDHRFHNITHNISFTVPGPEREEEMGNFWGYVYRYCGKSELESVRAKVRLLLKFISLHDEDLADEKGANEELERCRRAWGSSHVVEGGGDALQGISVSMGDGSNPAQSQRLRAGGGASQC
jgi:hypothetical protein